MCYCLAVDLCAESYLQLEETSLMMTGQHNALSIAEYHYPYFLKLVSGKRKYLLKMLLSAMPA